MKHCLLLSLLLALGCVHIRGAPVERGGMEEGSCEDPKAVGLAKEALTKINQHRKEGYIFSLHRLSNVYTTKHEENGTVFYLTLDVVETSSSVLSKKDWKTSEIRPVDDTPVRKHTLACARIELSSLLFLLTCSVPAHKVTELCPDCPTHISLDNSEVQKTVTLSLEKFNKESGLDKRFCVLKVTRAIAGLGMVRLFNVEYTIQETICLRNTEDVTCEKCPFMTCEFAHTGFCKSSLFYSPTGDADVSVECEIFEPETAERQKALHLLGGENDHSHSDAHVHDPLHDHAHTANDTHTHDHVHDHTKTHADHDKEHAHDHSHDHGHGHDHVHTHHAKAHDHSGDLPNHHHDYKHANSTHSHEHDHEHALDHDHKHPHMHEHEHHHHHHDHDHEGEKHDQPKGTVVMLPPLDQPIIVTAIPVTPVPIGPTVGPVVGSFPTSLSAQCPAPAVGETLVEKMFAEDPMFKPAA
uniref:Cystatin fetuin-B-type domain-containing protein n=1 Tax=Mola mola TaxID=94237 RepID=A0A3Q4BSM6_MOLML